MAGGTGQQQQQQQQGGGGGEKQKLTRGERREIQERQRAAKVGAQSTTHREGCFGVFGLVVCVGVLLLL